MTDRDVERATSRAEFVATLRRIADAMDRSQPVRIQVAGKRFTIPADAEVTIEHEAEGDEQELELQFKWTTADEED